MPAAALAWTSSSPVWNRPSKPKNETFTYRRSARATGQAGFHVERAATSRETGSIDDSKPSPAGGGRSLTVTSRRSTSSGGVGCAAAKPFGPTGSARVPSHAGRGFAVPVSSTVVVELVAPAAAASPEGVVVELGAVPVVPATAQAASNPAAASARATAPERRRREGTPRR